MDQNLLKISIATLLGTGIVFFLKRFISNSDQNFRDINRKIDNNLTHIREESKETRLLVQNSVSQFNQISKDATENMLLAKISVEDLDKATNKLNNSIEKELKPVVNDAMGKITIIEERVNTNTDTIGKVVTILKRTVNKKP